VCVCGVTFSTSIQHNLTCDRFFDDDDDDPIDNFSFPPTRIYYYETDHELSQWAHAAPFWIKTHPRALLLQKDVYCIRWGKFPTAQLVLVGCPDTFMNTNFSRGDL
jgi:hypothetical protein